MPVWEFHPIDNKALICYSKRRGDNIVITVVNLNPHHRQSGWLELDQTKLAMLHRRDLIRCTNQLSNARYLWSSARSYVDLDPAGMPAHVFVVRYRVRSEAASTISPDRRRPPGGRLRMNDPTARRHATNSDSGTAAGESLPTFQAASLSGLLRSVLPEPLQKRLRAHIRGSRWFRGKARTIRELEVLDQLPLRATPDEATFIIVRVSYVLDAPEVYVLPLAFAADTPATRAPAAHRRLFILERARRRPGAASSTTRAGELAHSLLELFVQSRRLASAAPSKQDAPRRCVACADRPTRPRRMPSGDQSNTTVFYGDEFTLKLFRQLERGEHPDIELNELSVGGRIPACARTAWQPALRAGGILRDARHRAALCAERRLLPGTLTLEIVQRSLEHARRCRRSRGRELVPSDDLVEAPPRTPPETMKPLPRALRGRS